MVDKLPEDPDWRPAARTIAMLVSVILLAAAMMVLSIVAAVHD